MSADEVISDVVGALFLDEVGLIGQSGGGEDRNECGCAAGISSTVCEFFELLARISPAERQHAQTMIVYSIFSEHTTLQL